jgi:hypothetical protein
MKSLLSLAPGFNPVFAFANDELAVSTASHAHRKAAEAAQEIRTASCTGLKPGVNESD